MEQLALSVPTTDTPEAVSEPTPVSRSNNSSHPELQAASVPTRGAVTSNSVPTLRFPRPVGNRRLTNWVSTSQPDIMRPSRSPGHVSLDASISDGYEVIGTDGESQLEPAGPFYERPASDLGDDVQSLADTDTGTDAYTNEVDTDSSDGDVDDVEEDDEDEEADLDYTVEPQDESAEQSDEEDHGVNMTMVERSLEHPTELFTPGSAHMSRQASMSEEFPIQTTHNDTLLERALSAVVGLSRGRAEAGITTQLTDLTEGHSADAHLKPSKSNKSGATFSARDAYENASAFLKRLALEFRQRNIQERWIRCMLLLPLLLASLAANQYMKSYTIPQSGVLTTVPVASVSSITTPSATEVLVSTSIATSTVTSTKTQSQALQTTASSKSVASIAPDSSLHMRQDICSASVHGRNEVLLKVPQQFKASWLAKHAVMISISRDTHDISSETTKITAVAEGFVIEVPQEEAYGVLDVSIATTRKPKIKETFHVNFGSFIIVDALDASKQLVKDFAQSLVDTLNGTTAWVEETCSPAFDLMSKPASVTDSIMQGIQEVANAALRLPGQVTDFASQPFPEGRAAQAGRELLRTAHDLQDEAALFILQAQLNSKLHWLRWSGQAAEYERYLAAAGPYYQQKQQEIAAAMHTRAGQTTKEIQSRRKQERRERRKSPRRVWNFGGGGS